MKWTSGARTRTPPRPARILANVSRFDRDVVEISTVAAVLNAYFQVLTAQDRLRIANQNVAIAQGVMDAINARLEVGTATVLDTSQQETILAQQRATIPPLEQTLRQTRNNLAVLLGQTPESMTIKGGSLRKAQVSADCAGSALGSAAAPPRRGRSGSAPRIAGIFGVAGAGRLFPVPDLDRPLWLPERAAVDARFCGRTPSPGRSPARSRSPCSTAGTCRANMTCRKAAIRNSRRFIASKF